MAPLVLTAQEAADAMVKGASPSFQLPHRLLAEDSADGHASTLESPVTGKRRKVGQKVDAKAPLTKGPKQASDHERTCLEICAGSGKLTATLSEQESSV